MANKFTSLAFSFLSLCLMLGAHHSEAQTEVVKKHKRGALYFSWGYNQEWYTTSNVHIEQKSLGNSYDFTQVRATDHKGWNDGILNKALTIPQYNYRLGYYFNEKQDLGVELNFDHTKYIIADGQTIQINGTMANTPVNQSVVFSQANGFYYYLNNGANFFLFNFVKRLGLYNSKDNNLKIDLVGKVGIGPVIPHVQNSFFGHANLPHFQLGGWNTGVESVLRFTIMKYGFIEFSEKVDYARYSHLSIYEGYARQSFGTIELIASAGFILPRHSDHPWFAKKGKSALLK
jgi:hypothetical protein